MDLCRALTGALLAFRPILRATFRATFRATVCATCCTAFLSTTASAAQDVAPLDAGAAATRNFAQASKPLPADGAPQQPRPPAPAEVRRVALVIGNAAYESLTPLKNAANDAEDMCAALKALGFDTRCHTNLRTRGDFRAAVRQFAAALGPGVSALFYFAGHGVQVKGENFLLPTAIAPVISLDVEDEGLSLSYLLRSIEEARSTPNVVILDTCRNDPFQSPATQTVKLARGLARAEPPLGTVLVYSTAPGREALDGRGRNGLFTKHLLRHIREPALSLGPLFETVSKAVEEEARNDYRFEQVPYRSFSYAGRFCFAGCEDQRVQRQVAALQQQSEQARRRIQELQDENARLTAQSQAQADAVQQLEKALQQLRTTSSTDSQRNQKINGDIARLQKELEAARAAQAATSALRQQNDQREAEIRALREEVKTLGDQSKKLEAYAARIQALEKDNQEKSRRLKEQGRASEPERQRSRVAPAF